jgi:hypothetical protein
MNKQHQVKSKWYYIFWGIMAIAVVGGQIYVGSGYRQMAEATKSTDIRITCEVIPPYEPPTKKMNVSREFE